MTTTDDPFVVSIPTAEPLAKTPQRHPAWWTPRTLEDAMKLAEQIASSTMVPKDYMGKPANVLLAMQFGAEIGLGPLAALQSIAVINGRPSLWGDALLAVCMSHRDWEWIKETIEGSGKVEDDYRAVCTVKRRGMAEKTVAFSVKDAKRAGLWQKAGPWTQYPQRMMPLRARAFCLRDTFPDALRGISSAEEMIDVKADVLGTEPLSGVAGLKARLGVVEDVKPKTGEVFDGPVRKLPDPHWSADTKLDDEPVGKQGEHGQAE